MSWAALLLMVLQPAAEAAPAEAAPAVQAPRVVPDGRCRRSSDNLSEQELVVCGRRVEPDRYRLPIRPDRFDPNGPVDSVSRERNGLLEEGDAGMGACSNVGPSGSAGCFHRNRRRQCQQEGCGVAF